jgi:hypothetical protein
MEDVERGLLAIRLLKVALAANPDEDLEAFADETWAELRGAWRFTKKLLNKDELAAFKDVLQNYQD